MLNFYWSCRINVHMTNKLNHLNGNLPENRKDHEPDGKASLIGNTADKSTENNSQTTNQSTDATYASQLSLENPKGFSRDAFGRQSMSEKRHATLDAKSTDTYQRTKKMREERIKKECKFTGTLTCVSLGFVVGLESLYVSCDNFFVSLFLMDLL